MEMQINFKLVKQLRQQKSWSQDQLASIASISLRTIQRIEKDGRCSIDSKKALASAFEIDATDLDTDQDIPRRLAGNRPGTKLGFLGAFAGLVGSYAGITSEVMSGQMTYGEAGIYFGAVGAACGLCCAIIGSMSRRFEAALQP